MKVTALFSTAAMCAVVAADVALYGQCGGQGYSGDSTCASGASCKEWNPWYSQCILEAGEPAPAPTPVEPTSAPATNETAIETMTTSPITEVTTAVSAEPTPTEAPEEEETVPAPTSPATPSGGSPTTPGSVTSVIPEAAGTVETNEPIYITGEFDGEMQRFDRDSQICQGQNEGGEADTIFVLEDGATLSNVIIGPNQGEGVYCLGQCTLNNVWFEDVCEDAMSFKGNAAQSFINGGGAFHADDKIIQFNGEGTIHVSNFYAEDYGKIARSCGTCEGGAGGRHFVMENVHGVNGGELCGVNVNYGDTCVITGNSCQAEGKSCTIWEGSPEGDEPTKLSSEPDGETCIAESLRDTC